MEQELIETYNFAQAQIDVIKLNVSKGFRLDIKQISDLQRYAEIQKNAMQSLAIVRELGLQ